MKFHESFALTRKLSRRKQGMLKPPVRLPLLPAMNIPLLPNRSRSRLFPQPISWLKALCLLPLAMPGVRVVLSGFAMYGWLNFPFSWVVATIVLLLMHVILPTLILAGVYWGVRSMWSTRSSISQAAWFSCSTMAIIVLSFCTTIGIAAISELTICRLPTAVILVGGSCSNHFVSSDIGDLISRMDTYDFRYYTWIVWFVVIAYMYQLEAHLHLRSLPQKIDHYSAEDLDSASFYEEPRVGTSIPVIDADVLDGSAHS
jgi:hypothetical protein